MMGVMEPYEDKLVVGDEGKGDGVSLFGDEFALFVVVGGVDSD